MHHEDEYLFPPAYHNDRERSHTPPMFTYSTYPPLPEDIAVQPYGAMPGYRTQETYPDYLAPHPVPVTLPSMNHFNDAIKREPSGYEENMQYMGYSNYLQGVDMSAGHPSPYEQMPHVSSTTRSPQHPQHLPHHHRARDTR